MNEDIKKQNWEVLEYFLTEKIDSMVKAFNSFCNYNSVKEDTIKNELVEKFGKICNKIYNKNKEYDNEELQKYVQTSVRNLIINEYNKQQSLLNKKQEYKEDKRREAQLKNTDKHYKLDIEDCNFNNLTKQQKEVIRYKLSDFNNKQISDILLISIDNVKKEYYRAINKIRKDSIL